MVFSGDSHISNCLPELRPGICSRESWKKLRRIYEGEDCPDNNGSFPPPGFDDSSLPPKYLDVPGYNVSTVSNLGVGPIFSVTKVIYKQSLTLMRHL